MNIPTTYQYIFERYSDKLQEIRAKLLKSTSKEKDVPLQYWSWSFVFCVKTNDCYRVSDILQGNIHPRQTPQQIYEDRLKNTSCDILVSRKNAWFRTSALKSIPQEVVAYWEKEKETNEKFYTPTPTKCPLS